MAISFKMQGETARCDEHMCGTCRNVSIVKSSRGQELQHCHALRIRIDEKIVQCSSYQDSRTPTLHDFYDIAWTVRTDKTGKAIGFERPNKSDDDFPRPPVGF